jgi:hypothetical protein
MHRQHAHEVHRPDARAQHQRATYRPQDAGTGIRVAHAPREVERDVRRIGRHQHRQRHHAQVVVLIHESGGHAGLGARRDSGVVRGCPCGTRGGKSPYRPAQVLLEHRRPRWPTVARVKTERPGMAGAFSRGEPVDLSSARPGRPARLSGTARLRRRWRRGGRR